MKGIAAQAKVVGFERFLNRPACVFRYQRMCNHSLGDEGCGINMASYYDSYTVNSVAADGRTLELSGWGAYNGIFTLGYIKNQAESERRMIVSHSNKTCELRYKFSASVQGQTCKVYQGCDKTIGTCKTKFDNVDNFLGFPYIPSDNPATRSLI